MRARQNTEGGGRDAHLVGVNQKKARNGQMTVSGASSRPEKIMHAP